MVKTRKDVTQNLRLRLNGTDALSNLGGTEKRGRSKYINEVRHRTSEHIRLTSVMTGGGRVKTMTKARGVYSKQNGRRTSLLTHTERGECDNVITYYSKF